MMKKLSSILIALTAWFAVISQLVIVVDTTDSGLFGAILFYISFFTILSNILVAITFSAMQFSSTHAGHFASKTETVTAVTVYILVVGIVFNLVLRKLWITQGFQTVVNELLHSVVPLMVLAFWSAFLTSKRIAWHYAFYWLFYPAVYLVYTLSRGHFTKYYPYPFIDVNMLGYSGALINAGVVLLLFIILSIGLISLTRMSSQREA